MHPNTAFRHDEDALAFVATTGFAHIFGATPDGPRVAHAPVLVTPQGTLMFHLSNGNALAKHLDGLTALISVGGPGHYVSPNWYVVPADNVPTWNYQAVEIEGQVRALDMEELEALLHFASATFEPRVGEDWTMHKMERARAEAMMRAITGFELTPTAIRTTLKASQNRSDADAAGVIAALERLGETAGAAAIRKARK
ncbi:FMN-binding negative transcriptional regulator [Sandarakinorhabdus sp. AAP62]|uniref:FMN-binding negative transcriptional regulator n=1 Tax=Sandarakinorhabdus sp. AAP62 TaxID=1248916 RepID=UPI0002DF6B0B|nr:FMN-binding negative transcriptional regulator [Sandarakinorhabdus sp. AAP62]